MFINSVIDITITDVISALRIVNAPVGITTKRKNRERWAIALKLTGKTIYTVEEKEYICDPFHPLLLPKGCSYSWKCIVPGVCLMIEFEALQEYADICSFYVSENTFFTTAFSKIDRALNRRSCDHKIDCMYRLYGILSHLTKAKNKEYITKDRQNLLAPAVDYITQNYFNGDITNDVLAKLCGISTVYFRKTFEAAYNVPPIKYLHKYRIEMAKKILLSDYGSIEQVALSVGYNSLYHFSKMFKIYTGISPSEYAKASRN